jgi:ribonuclease E
VDIEDEPDEFGAGVADPEPAMTGALYDPGPDVTAGDDFEDAAAEPLDEEDEGDEVAGETEGGPEGHDGGKRKRRRRRRRKKGGPGTSEPAAEPADVGERGEPVERGEPAEAEDAVVEEGEAPAEVEGDDDEPAPPTAVDEELVAEAAGPRPEWHVMTWMELVSKLYRPN